MKTPLSVLRLPRVKPSASSLHNVGLITMKQRIMKGVASIFEQALEMEKNDLAAHYIAYAKVQEK